jgi:RNA polymerase primary sigma factor
MDNYDSKKEFQETLTELVEFATVSGNQITKETVQSYFRDLITDDAQYNLIYQYLEKANITVAGYTPQNFPDRHDSADTQDFHATSDSQEATHKKSEESHQAHAFYEMYLDEVSQLNTSETEDSKLQLAKMLLSKLLLGDSTVSGALSEFYLPLVIEIAKSFADHGLAQGDLVSEGNLALCEGILAYPDLAVQQEDSDAALHTFERYLAEQICNALRAAINEEISSNRISNHLTEQVNALNDASTELAKELGREPTLDELCRYLSLGEDEVKELMKVSINALSVVQTEE